MKDKKVFCRIKDLDYVNYLGFKTKDEFIRIYRENDIFVLPSINETFGLVYAGAMSQGLPVVYTKDQGFDGQFKDGIVAFSANHKCPTEIAKKINGLVANYKTLSLSCVNNSSF
ncbi:glycosyltransferase [Clostridium sp. D2Q-14]|uniref:glycosyltransferase n=1 Tax=Anaeromonas gelatinilytica TaxID=2683194 RepID=UPI00193B049C|nr:glycosyltransferase [Anaeromonas gelatinilytica]